MPTKVIGIDPDSNGFQCILVDTEADKMISRQYFYTETGLIRFLEWTEKNGSPIICIEGKNGQCRPLESFLHENKTPFYSVSPKQTNKFRESVVSENKDNEIDAEAVARLGITLGNQNKLGEHRVIEETSNVFEIRELSRIQQKATENRTVAVNCLWKKVHSGSSDLYLYLKGCSPDAESENNIIQNKGILNLLIAQPDLAKWKNLTYDDLFQAMGGQNYKGRDVIIKSVTAIMEKFKNISVSDRIGMEMYAKQILFHSQEIKMLEKELLKLTEGDPIIEQMMEYKGIGCNTASALRGEILNPARFKTNDNLASYAGFGMKKVATGKTVKMVRNNSYNRRLKNTFITAAKSLIRHHGDKHLTGYYNSLVNRNNLEKTEIYKRVARAWLRMIYKNILAPQGGKTSK